MKDEIEAKEIKPCPTCGACCVIGGDITRYYMPVDLKYVDTLAKRSKNKALQEKIDTMLLNLATFLSKSA